MDLTQTTLEVDDATLYYEVRGSGSLLVLVGAPMDATSFAPLAELLAAGHTVLTTDPRGVNRSTLRGHGSTPEQRAGDLARLIGHLDLGPAIAFGSSGGAVSVLALAQNHPDVVHTVIAHEPPLDQLLPDAESLLAGAEQLMADYLAGDVIGAWKQFFEQANIALPDQAFEAMFGGERDPRVLADERFWFEHEMRETIRWQPDLTALRSAQVVIGIGEESAGQLCERTSIALAAGLGIEPVRFPGGHIAFVEQPGPFAAALRGTFATNR
jgi:pimeloyl-ACP methyl ester carboxylesterase